jgi:hypothetical protein
VGKISPDNAFRHTFIARAKIMMDGVKESEQLIYSGTKGSLREAYLKDFLVFAFSHRFDLTRLQIQLLFQQTPKPLLYVYNEVDRSPTALFTNRFVPPWRST